MKQRILSGWNFQRFIYVVLGVAVIVQSAIQREWIGILLGIYFVSMGIFALGCAAGNCFGGSCYTEKPGKNKAGIQKVNFDEVKAK